jgi:predicted metal-binding protein
MANKIDPIARQNIEDLARKAIEHGATSSTIISSKEIQVKEELAALCNGEFICPNYGRGAGCPPYVEGPVEFQKWQAESEYSITVKIELPTSVMFSSERNNVMRLLHQIVSTVEIKAIEAGFTQSKGFAGGSCRELFCDDQKDCSVIAEGKLCRYIERARPSMSGFGIDVSLLMQASGWSGAIADQSTLSDNDKMSWVAGLILLA